MWPGKRLSRTWQQRLIAFVIIWAGLVTIADGSLPRAETYRAEPCGIALIGACLPRRVVGEHTQGTVAETAQGFTLLELAIVLMVIGAIVGGILAGQEMIRQATLRKTATELQKFQAAFTTFRAKYNGIPGDLSNATTFFGQATGCPSPTTAQYNGTCNGEGTGIVNAGWDYGDGVQQTAYVFNQLSLAQMIPGSYPIGPFSASSGGIPQFQIGYNAPASAWAANIGYEIMTVVPGNTSSANPAPGFSLVIQIGGSGCADGGWCDYMAGAGLNAVDAQALDNKIDDGSPGSGLLMAKNAIQISPGNPNTACISSGKYLTSSATGCTLDYLLKAQ